jgi:uncharacterized protein (UPF0262 family)
MDEGGRDRLFDVRLDETSLTAASADAEHDRRVAIFDLLESNLFILEGIDEGPYALTIAVQEQRRLALDISNRQGQPVRAVILALSSFRQIVKDYFMICDSYYEAIRKSTPMQIEAIDMARRGLHNEAAELLQERLAGKVKIDHDTARRLFTLICALHARA